MAQGLDIPHFSISNKTPTSLPLPPPPTLAQRTHELWAPHQ